MDTVIIELSNKTVVKDDISGVTHNGSPQTTLTVGSAYAHTVGMSKTHFVVTSIFSSYYGGLLYIGHEVPSAPQAAQTPTP